MWQSVLFVVRRSASLMRRSDEWALGRSAPTWGWHGHNGHTPGTGGLLPPATVAVHIQQMARLGPPMAGAAEESTPLCVNVCALLKNWALTIGIGLSTRIHSFVWGHLLRLCVCAQVCVGHAECPFIVNAQQCLKVQKWPRELLQITRVSLSLLTALLHRQRHFSFFREEDIKRGEWYSTVYVKLARWQMNKDTQWPMTGQAKQTEIMKQSKGMEAFNP